MTKLITRPCSPDLNRKVRFLGVLTNHATKIFGSLNSACICPNVLVESSSGLPRCFPHNFPVRGGITGTEFRITLDELSRNVVQLTEVPMIRDGFAQLGVFRPGVIWLTFRRIMK